mgnify:CR=1 FL=1
MLAWRHFHQGEAEAYRFVEVTRGDVRSVVTSTGTLQAITTGTASVTLEKVIELVGNFTFLLVGLTLIARLEFFQDRAGAGFIVLALFMPLVSLIQSVQE